MRVSVNSVLVTPISMAGRGKEISTKAGIHMFSYIKLVPFQSQIHLNLLQSKQSTYTHPPSSLTFDQPFANRVPLGSQACYESELVTSLQQAERNDCSVTQLYIEKALKCIVT